MWSIINDLDGVIMVLADLLLLLKDDDRYKNTYKRAKKAHRVLALLCEELKKHHEQEV